MKRASSRLLTLPAQSTRSSLLAPRPSRGFTLVELLVVITIIAILASLLVVAAMAAMNRARFAKNKVEVDSLSDGMEKYKNEISGGDFPPNAMVNPANGTMRTLTANANPQQVQNDMIRHFKKVAPRMRGEEALVTALAGGALANSTIYNGPSLGTGTVLQGGLSPAEALVFWLNGFSSDPKAPLTGSGGPVYDKANFGVNGGVEGRTTFFPFEVTRLGPRDSNGNFAGRFIEFPGPNSVTYRLNLWQYYPDGSNEPLVYFDTSRPLLEVEPIAGSPEPHLHAIKQAATGSTAPIPIRYANEGKFQILHCGLDERWGNFAAMSIIDTPVANLLLYPKGPFTLDLADTITNFTTGTLEDAQQ